MVKFKERREIFVNGSDKKASGSFTPGVLDPALTTLFSKSLGPVKSAQIPVIRSFQSSAAEDSLAHSLSCPKNDESISEFALRNRVSDSREGHDQHISGFGRKLNDYFTKKRKRNNNNDDDLEGRYMHRLGHEGSKENVEGHGERTTKRHLQEGDIGSTTLEELDSGLGIADMLKEDDNGRSDIEIPRHESLAASGIDTDLRKALRTVFLANVSTVAIKSKSARKTLITHLESSITTLPKQDVAHKVESLRFRSTAFSSTALPKKVAYAKKELMDSTTKSTNAYVVYSTEIAAREALNRLNGTIVLDRHLRVDGVANPAKIDHRRCVFVGNLGFVDDESMIDATKDEENDRRPQKRKEPADAEEGLWRQFSKAGVVESVRVIRDKATRVGKGFAYVQFQDENGVEKALLYHEKKFPPLLPRILRVTRARSIKNSTTHNRRHGNKHGVLSKSAGIYQPRLSLEAQSLAGRAGAAYLKNSGHINHHPNQKLNHIAKTPESIVFEGHRANRSQGKEPLRSGGSGKREGKPRSRSSKRGAPFKASGGIKRKSR